MKTKILQFVVAFCFLGSLPVKTVALNYTISFTGTGASTTIDSVIVQNLTQGTSITVPAGNILNLSDVPTVIEPLDANDETIRIYPTSADGKSIVSFFAKQAGSTQLSVFSIDGRKVAGISIDLQTGSNTFELSLPKGVFVIQVTGNEYAFTAKMLNPTGTQSKPEIVYTGTEKPSSMNPQKTKSNIPGITTMTYTAGDRLLYNGISGKYSTIVTDVPTGSKTTNLNFVACKDADGNNYATVTIGTQTWMAENLKTTLYNDSTAIPFITDSTAWTNQITPGYCWYNNDAATYKNTYGALYNWYSVNTGTLAPAGWHVAAVADLQTLENYLIANGYNYDGSTSGDLFAKSLAATTNWIPATGKGTIGNDLSKNNRTGFSALPGGCRINGGFYTAGSRSDWWSSTGSGVYVAIRWELNYNGSDLDWSSGYGKPDGFSVRCVRDTLSLPTLTTTAASSITTTTATTGGNITNDGGASITVRGVCWSTSANPTIADSITTGGTGAGIFTSALTGLTANTTYYIRAYATNSVGTGYGAQLSFTTAVTDKDGNVYHTVTIGTQTWMVENLKTTKYNDGTAIPFITDNSAWANLTTPGYCWYNNDSTTYKNMYGALYNWYAVSTGNLAPKGWHVATDAEWTTLQNYLITNGYNYDGSTSGNLIAKSLADTISWATDTGTGTIGNDLTKNNRSGFSALPGGNRDSGGFNNATLAGFWWSSTGGDASDAWSRHLDNDNRILYSNDYLKYYGFSVRCVRDN